MSRTFLQNSSDGLQLWNRLHNNCQSLRLFEGIFQRNCFKNPDLRLNQKIPGHGTYFGAFKNAEF